MKILATLFALFLAGQAHAQVGPEVYRPISPTVVGGISSGPTTVMTSAFVTRMARFICTSDCWLSLLVSNHDASGSFITPAQVAGEGIFLPANVPQDYIVSPDGKFAVKADSTAGKIIVIQLSK